MEISCSPIAVVIAAAALSFPLPLRLMKTIESKKHNSREAFIGLNAETPAEEGVSRLN